MTRKRLGIIPARWASSRFPGKPLELIGDKPMILHVYERCLEAECLDQVVVATDDERIVTACQELYMMYVRTRSDHQDCLDRSAEVAQMIEAECYITVQGDEPFISPEAIRIVARTPEEVVCGFSIINEPKDWLDPTIPKVVTNEAGYMVYMSRAPIPYFQRRMRVPIKFQVCVYRHTRQALECYSLKGPTLLEKTESIGLLRYLDTSLRVRMVAVPPSPVAVDTPGDLERARELWSERGTQ